MSYVDDYLRDVKSITGLLDHAVIEKMLDVLIDIRKKKGRLFFLGVGGGAGNASHAVNDFRKIASIKSYSPTDNVSKLTARINDNGWESSFAELLIVSNLNSKDSIFVFSVGGGNTEKNVSVNLVNALKYARKVKAKVLGIVGRDGGYTGQIADVCLIIPTVNTSTVTPHTEAFQSVIWHLLVSYPRLHTAETKWESIK